jgi:hypothetical protein
VSGAKLIIARTAAKGMKVRSLDVFVDDRFVADLAFGKSLSVDLEPGEHSVKVSNRLYTRELQVRLAPGDRKRVQVGNILGRLGMVLIGVGLPFYHVFVEEEDPAPAG